MVSRLVTMVRMTQTDLSVKLRSVTTAGERILTVASDLFYREGIRAVGIDRIIAEAGVAKASLYANFKSKDELIVAYLAHQSGVWRDDVDAALAAIEDPAEGIRRLFEVLADDFDDSVFRGCPFANAAAEYPDAAHPSRRVIDDYRSWLRERLTGLARAAELQHPGGVATALVMVYDGACVSAKLGDPRSTRKATLAAVDQLIDGARPQPRPPTRKKISR
jgi:AcrR family transcriptional regulator